MIFSRLQNYSSLASVIFTITALIIPLQGCSGDSSGGDSSNGGSSKPFDPCAERVCGITDTGDDCGTCLGETESCNVLGQCIELPVPDRIICDGSGQCYQLTVPTSPVCWSPCTEGLSDSAGTYRHCSAEGLLEGCIGNATCERGACIVEANSSYPNCSSETECPDYQTCLADRCVSNCESDYDCPGTLECYRKVCRFACDVGSIDCGEGFYCHSSDSLTGHCLPLADASGTRSQVVGSFSVDRKNLSLSNVKLRDHFTIMNRSPRTLEFTVSKVAQVEVTAHGATQIQTAPLAWLKLGATGAETQIQAYSVLIDSGASATVSVTDVLNPALPAWNGALEISTPSIGSERVYLEYRSQADGKWSGEIHYFANFPTTGLAAWEADPSNSALLAQVGNAFVQQWGGLKKGTLNFNEFKAMLAATKNGSWRWASMEQYCPDANTACYLYNNTQGYKIYTDSLTQNPLPTGVTELPIAMILKTDSSDNTKLIGAIDSTSALHYGGHPAIAFSFAGSPSSCATMRGGVSICDITAMDATISVGGRYMTDSSDTNCHLAPMDGGSSTFTLMQLPSLIAGFTWGTEQDLQTGLRYRYECRDTWLPAGTAASHREQNIVMAASNPIPDGRTRKRVISLVDGMMIGQELMVILFKEQFTSFLGADDTDGFAAYGVMTLSRTPADVAPQDYIGSSVVDNRSAPQDILNVSCSPQVLTTTIGQSTFPTDPTTINSLAEILVSGIASAASQTPLDPLTVSTYCEATGLFNGGIGGSNSAGLITDTPVIACPAGSKVTYFTSTFTRSELSLASCNSGFSYGTIGTIGSGGGTGVTIDVTRLGQVQSHEILTRATCGNTLANMVELGTSGIQLNPIWRCSDSTLAYCSQDRSNLTAGKDFFAPNTAAAVYMPLRTDVASAFRYKTAFQNRNGQSVGFAPEICIPGSDQTPYCYSPTDIESAQSRSDCALYVYTHHLADLSSGASGNKLLLQNYLTTHFGYEEEVTSTNTRIRHDGFERLNAELLIMMGDESYTKAFASRFDLAGSRMRNFEGALFEPNGINLAGGAGFEMYSLYQAVQYYQKALDRFYRLSPIIWKSVKMLGVADGFVTKETVVGYFDRLIRASSQKARAWSEIASHYQKFNRPDLARSVTLRAYTAGYLESVILSRMMLKLLDIAQPQDRALITQQVERAQRVYRSSLLKMEEGFQNITDNLSMFGFDPDYIPFPALDVADTNAFDKLLSSAKAKMTDALVKEQTAIHSNRSFDTDAVLFQSELVTIQNSYENQLAAICGTFQGDDGQIYAALPRYAERSTLTAATGDPCGFVATGSIYSKMLEADVAVASLQGTIQKITDLDSRLRIEEKRVTAQCDLIDNKLTYQIEFEGNISTQTIIRGAGETAVALGNAVVQSIWRTGMLSKCFVIAGTAVGSNCPAAAVNTGLYTFAKGAATAMVVGGNVAIAAAKSEISNLQNARGHWLLQNECDVATTDSNAKMAALMLGYKHLELDVLKAELQLKRVYSEVTQLRNQATRLMAEQDEAEQMTINVEATRNDPNVRIYKNDAILNADRTFQLALKSVYKATKVYEYYTSQSYAHLADLFLIRMVGSGDISLESYVADLESNFVTFEEQFGNPDLRVAILSLKDDILNIPLSSSQGTPLTQTERLALFRAELRDVTRLDGRGYLTIPFATHLGELSPVTRNHKVAAMEAEIIGSDTGDNIGRVYLNQRGTGTVHTVDGTQQFFLLPQRNAVIDTFFNGDRIFDTAIYRNERLKDRPFVNSRWELIFNQRDEWVNKDINTDSLTDIRIYIYYTDFTQL